MDRTEPVTLTNMCMIVKDKKILVLNRKNPNWPGLTFPGGHLEPHESIHDSVIREVKEETNLTIRKPQFVGVKHFYDENDHRYLVFFYTATDFSGTVKASREGRLTWMTKDELIKEKLAVNFDRDLPLYFDQTIFEHFCDGDLDLLF